MDGFKREPGRRFPFKPKVEHPTKHRTVIDELLKRTVYREPKIEKPYAPPVKR